MAGGGPLGAIFEIGALCAIEESIAGLDLRNCHSYLGVSSGGFIAAGLCNGMSPRELSSVFIENSTPAHDRFDPNELMRPDWPEFRQRLERLPGLLAAASWQMLAEGRAPLSALEQLGRALPTGLLSGEALAQQLHRQFSLKGRSDDFRRLKHRLVLVATDLDSGEAVPFGMPGWDHVPVSRAVQASAALPGLFPPVTIDGRHYVDGALKKTLHASVLLDEGADLLICVNPLVPYASDTHGASGSSATSIPSLVEGGLPVVLSQTFRSLIHSRLELGMKGYAHSHPNADILLFEPSKQDAELFLANTFSYSQRRHLAEHAFQSTRRQLLANSHAINAKLARHGLSLDVERLLDSSRHLVADASHTADAGSRARLTRQALMRLDHALSLLESRYKT